jgi:hypothetical protein
LGQIGRNLINNSQQSSGDFKRNLLLQKMTAIRLAGPACLKDVVGKTTND